MTIGEAVLERAEYPFDSAFYDDLYRRRSSFALVSEHDTEETGYGFRVRAGQAWRLTLLEGAQILDVCMVNGDDPRERFFSAAQMSNEGGKVTRGIRLWGTPPRSRPLATCIADTVRPRENPRATRDHYAYGAHCNAHLWHLYAGVHHRPCYDNLRYGFAQMGLDQYAVHDNVNLFQKGAYDPWTGAHLVEESDSVRGDHIEFFAEIDLIVSVSLCPNGAGSDALRGSWSESGPTVPVHPIRVSILDTGSTPLRWPPTDISRTSRPVTTAHRAATTKEVNRE
ncbi:urea carboxylase-associated family protein [Conexibacter sp. CPCC 206217]|uniref:urea carboxylase-associated family protein n=1 Tax=Conexibacter sp. CPCC 206217 TaxID=3064574 RepID=UPI00271F56CE|nr:urea carboxylase-associated family protein [Conexibacter sp. CPCC 206217]MDO8210189.1 urea carboxylase-associated family protein [Conexibacter sp. CPCC 206217]